VPVGVVSSERNAVSVSFLKITCSLSIAYVLVLLVAVFVLSMGDSAPRNHVVGHGITRCSKAYAVVM
jgi:hypothetical protein